MIHVSRRNAYSLTDSEPTCYTWRENNNNICIREIGIQAVMPRSVTGSKPPLISPCAHSQAAVEHRVSPWCDVRAQKPTPQPRDKPSPTFVNHVTGTGHTGPLATRHRAYQYMIV